MLAFFIFCWRMDDRRRRDASALMYKMDNRDPSLSARDVRRLEVSVNGRVERASEGLLVDAAASSSMSCRLRSTASACSHRERQKS